MVVAPTALPPLGQRSPDAVLLARPDVQADLRLTGEQRRRFVRLDASGRERQDELDGMADATNQNAYSALPLRDIDALESVQLDLNDDIDQLSLRLLRKGPL